ncbi:MAG: aminoglycoside phosphotransferase [Alphaproteobacteria bacterium]|nr:aminoglycoside phosphotransferase [Alphaproteobacteria bacterium]
MSAPREMDAKERGQRRAQLLDRAGWGDARCSKLAGDASFRSYDRVHLQGRVAVLMDAPPPMEDVRPFVAVAERLVSLGLSAPRVLAADVEAGYLLLEDLGDNTYTRMLASGGDERMLYALAVDLLADLHRQPPDVAARGMPDYSDDLLLREAALLVDWYLPAVTGEPAPESVRRAYLDVWRAVLPAARDVPTTLVLRDYHVDNLVWLDDRPGVAACGLLDFQDAVAGPISYDVVSLLEDARRDIEARLVADMRARYLEASGRVGSADRIAFDRSYAVLGAQRNCKIVGIFTRLCVRDGKPGYLKHIPRVWRLIEGDLAHPVLEPLRAWLERHIPGDMRGIPEIAREMAR